MRILHLVTLFSPNGAFGGPLRVALNQVSALRELGHDVDLVAGWEGTDPAPEAVDGVAIRTFPARRVPGFPGFSGLVSPRMVRWLASEVPGYDVVHVHAARDLVCLPALGVLAARGVPYVTQTHGMVIPDRRPAIGVLDAVATRRLLRRARTRFVLTDLEAQQLADVVGTADGSVRLPNGVPVPAVTWDPVIDGGPEVLYCARLDQRKRPVAFVEMAAELTRRGVDARFTLIGPDEGELAAVRTAIETHGLADRVTYEGALPYEAIAPRMARASVYVLPSVNEPFPMSLLEALSIGVPSVCTTSCGIAADLGDVQAALITEPPPPALADAVGQALQADAAQSLHSAAVRATRTRYSGLAVATTLAARYRELAGGEPTATDTAALGNGTTAP